MFDAPTVVLVFRRAKFQWYGIWHSDLDIFKESPKQRGCPSTLMRTEVSRPTVCPAKYSRLVVLDMVSDGCLARAGFPEVALPGKEQYTKCIEWTS